jgi:hypothetical protein
LEYHHRDRQGAGERRVLIDRRTVTGHPDDVLSGLWAASTLQDISLFMFPFAHEWED